MSNHKSCLVLNADYTPICIIDWQKALILWYRQENGYNKNIQILDYHKNDFIQSSSAKIRIPSILRIVKYCNIFHRPIKFSRRNLFIRDSNTCQYCGVKKNDHKQLTYDHIIPKSKWSQSRTQATNWLNIVTACVDCNLKKADRTPQQANMPLLKSPFAPIKNEKYLPITQHLLTIKEIPDEWYPYIPKNYLNT